MAAMPSTGQLIYHMTSIDNLSSILKFGLLSRNHLLQNSNIQFTDIADPEILSKRERYKKPFLNMCYFISLQKIHLTAQCVENTDRRTW